MANAKRRFDMNEALSAFISIISIIAIVVVAGGLIAFIGHMIIGVFDNSNKAPKQQNKDVIDYAQYKQLENAANFNQQKEYDFEAINRSKAQKEKEMLEKEDATFYALDKDKDEELEAIENRLKNQPVKESEFDSIGSEIMDGLEEDLDDLDFDSMLDEISEDVLEEEKTQSQESSKMSDALLAYNIDDMLKEVQEELEEEVEEEPVAEPETIAKIVEEEQVEKAEAIAEPEVVAEEPVEEPAHIVVEEPAEEEPDLPKFDNEDLEAFEDEDLDDEDLSDLEDFEEEFVAIPRLAPIPEKNPEVEALKVQLAELQRQLEEAKNNVQKVEVVKLDMTEEECVARLETLEERLKNAKKDYKINMKEYRPLKKVMNDLEKYQTKLRRKETIVAKKKVALYGVNNYVDIDKEKAEKLANELELLDGLRLSVSHCEEVITANKDRFPILEHTNQILENQIETLEADIQSTQATLQKIRDRRGNGEGSKK